MYLQKLCSFVTIRSRWATFQGLWKNRITMLNVYLNLLHKQQESKIFYEAEIFKRRTQRFVWLQGVRLLHTRTTSGQTTTEICPAATSFPFSFTSVVFAMKLAVPEKASVLTQFVAYVIKSYSTLHFSVVALI